MKVKKEWLINWRHVKNIYMTRLNTLLFSYLAWEFLKKLALIFCLLMGIVYLFEAIEWFNRADDNDPVTPFLMFEMAFYKLPQVGHEIVPFIVFFAAIAVLRSLSDRHELVILRASGLSVWQFLIPLLCTTLVVSLLYIMAFHPVFASMMSRYERMNNFYFGDGRETITRIGDGLWLRQEDETGNFILKAEDLNARKWIMKDVVVFFFDEANQHSQRIDAATAQLGDGEWVFSDVSVHQTDTEPRLLPILRLTTTLTPQTIQESFTAPQSISFWRLPGFITDLQPTGLDIMPLRSYYQSLLSQPLLVMAMVFLAAVIALKTDRMTKMFPIIAYALAATAAVFFISNFLMTLARGYEIPLILAVWSTPVLILLFSVYFLSHKEDG
jgi:lipopolysaccharide export system permease protein